MAAAANAKARYMSPTADPVQSAENSGDASGGAAAGPDDDDDDDEGDDDMAASTALLLLRYCYWKFTW
jgi:hypothetical protein